MESENLEFDFSKKKKSKRHKRRLEVATISDSKLFEEMRGLFNTGVRSAGNLCRFILVRNTYRKLSKLPTIPIDPQCASVHFRLLHPDLVCDCGKHSHTLKMKTKP